MKTKAIFFSAALACAATVPLTSLAQTTVYGRIDVGMDSVTTNVNTLTSMRDNASRLGFRGTEDLGGGLNAVFGVEMGFAADTGALGSPMMRNSYVGLTGGFGAFAMGRLDSANPTGSPIYSLVTRHMEFVIHDAGAPAIGSAVLNARNRESNAIGYASPEISGVVLRARYYLNGEGAPEPIDVRSLDISASYGGGKNPLGIGLGYGRDDRNAGHPLNTFKEKWMLIGSYDFGIVRAWAVVGQDRYQSGPASRSDVDVRLIGASIPVGTGGSKVIVNLMRRDVQTDRNGTLEKSQIGYSHVLSKRSQLFALYDVQNSNNAVANSTANRLSLGMQHNF